MSLLALRAGRPSRSGRFLVPIYIRSVVDPEATVRLEALRQLKNPMISSGIRQLPACSRMIRQLRYRVPLSIFVRDLNLSLDNNSFFLTSCVKNSLHFTRNRLHSQEE